MTRPDWKDAPRWATHAAMDRSGAWYWFDGEPDLDKGLGMWCAGSKRMEAHTLDGWDKSLEARPAERAPGSGEKPLTRKGVKAIESPSLGQPLTWETLGIEPSGDTRRTCADVVVWLAGGWTAETLVQCGHARWIG